MATSLNDGLPDGFELEPAGPAASPAPQPAVPPLPPGFNLERPAPAEPPQYDVNDRSVPASIRHNNPGAMWPGPSARKFGSTTFQDLADGNKIATFDTPAQGAAAQFDLLARKYAGQPLHSAIRTWSGGNSVPSYLGGVIDRTGLDMDTVLTPELLSDPNVAIPLAKAMAQHEAGQPSPLTEDDWLNGFAMAYNQKSAPSLPENDFLRDVLSKPEDQRRAFLEEKVHDLLGLPLDLTAPAGTLGRGKTPMPVETGTPLPERNPLRDKGASPALPPGFELEPSPAQKPTAATSASGDQPWALPQGFMGAIMGSNPKMFGDAAEGLGVILDNQSLQDTGKWMSGIGKEELDKYKARVPGVENIRRDTVGNVLSDLGAYAGYSAGNALGTSAPSLVAGGLTTMATANPLLGLAIGAAGPSIAQNFGDVYGSMKDDEGIKGRLDKGELSPKFVAKVALAASLPIAALDVFSLTSITGKVTGIDEIKKTIARDIAHGIATGAITEGTTEGAQEVISQAVQKAIGGDNTAGQAVLSVVNNAFGGLFGGGLIGGGESVATYPSGLTKVKAGIEKGKGLGFEPTGPEGDGGPSGPAPTGGAIAPPVPKPGPKAQPVTPDVIPMPDQSSGPVPSAAAPVAAPAASSPPPDTRAGEDALLRGAHWSEDDIAAMEPEERAQELQDARDRGVKPAPASAPQAGEPAPAPPPVPERPSAEPMADLVAQAQDVANPENPRAAVYLSKANLDQIRAKPDSLGSLKGMLPRSTVVLDNFDGQGGAILVKDRAAADKALADRAAGRPMQEILGGLTGAGTGKPAGGDRMVQQVTPEGAVTRESVVTAADQAKTEAEFAAPGRTVRTVSLEEGLARRQNEIANPTVSVPLTPTAAAIQTAAETVSTPTEGQKEAGNYRKGHARVSGLDVTIETPKGAERRGQSPDGTPWQVTMPAHYGYVKGTTGNDGDQVDVYIGPNPHSDSVFVVDQFDAETGKFDEHKALLGFDNADQALTTYRAGFSDGKADQRLGGVVEMAPDEFKDWVNQGQRTEPVSELGRQRAAKVPAAQEKSGTPAQKIVTPDGSMKISARPEVVELSSLKQASGALQPRDRSRAESAVGVRDRAVNLDPDQLQPARVSDTGAPIVLPDNTILSGNGRTLSLAEVYRNPALTAQAERYRASLGDAARGMKEPVLIMRSESLSETDQARFADLSNRSRIAAMSATERAMADAKAMSENMGLYEGGDFTAPQNRLFFRTFLKEAVSSQELGSVSKNGELTKDGQDRMTAAVLAAAYGDADMLSVMLESTDDNIKNFVGALRDAAGHFVRLKADIDAGVVPAQYDITKSLVETVKLISDLRARGIKPAEYLAQADAFTRVSPITEGLMRAFYTDDLSRALSRQKITEVLTDYADEAAKKREAGFLPDTTRPEDIVASGRQRRANEGQGLFAERPARAGDEEGRAQAQGQAPDQGGTRSSVEDVKAEAPPSLALAPPSFDDLMEALPRDDNGDRDVTALQKAMRSIAGKPAWTTLTDREKIAVWSLF